jgi:pimeloyl-ACP methyl ester carboxylesterase
MRRTTRQLALLSLCTSLWLGGCGGDTTSDGAPGGTTSSPVVLFDPVAASPVVPFPNNLFFSGTTDGTLNIPNPSAAPFVTQANLLDGFSTVESAFLDILGELIFSSVASGIRVVNANTGTVLTQGLDYTVTRSPVILTRTRLLIKPLRPLNPRTQYIVFATRDLLGSNGLPVEQSVMFAAVKSTDPVGSPGNPVPSTTPPLNSTQIATLEAIRQAMAPIFNSVAPLLGLARDDIVLAWAFTTQSIADSLVELNAAATAQTIAAVAAPGPGGTLSTGELGIPGLADTADVFVGSVNLPYYLTPPSMGDPTAPLTKFWESDGSDSGGNSSLPGSPPCSALAPSFSTTACFPTPLLKTTLTVPLLVTVPNGNSGMTKPPAGWPVVIFQHGITRNRTDMFAIAPTLANAGFVTVAIDHPLHGITDTANPFYAGSAERTFNLDFVNNSTSAAGPDGLIDPSGTHFINLSSLITSRDNLRQSTIDIIHLAKSVGALNLDGNAMTDDIDESKIHFVGHSLGGIAGTVALGVNSSELKAATLAMPGGGIAKLLDGSPTFGPRIAGGLFAANSALLEGTDSYESFLRFAQTLVDAADPINYAVAANANHPIHMLEVIGEAGVSLPDQVVPNSVPRTAPSASICPTYTGTGVPPGARGPVCVAGLLSGTDPLFQVMGLSVSEITPPVVGAPTAVSGDRVVRFRRGNHGSILDPSGSAENAATTCEMQRQTATFLFSAGAGFQIGGLTCP